DRVSGIVCQLLNPIEDEDLERLLDDNDWAAQEKMDGERRLVRKEAGQTVGVNRKGLIVPLPEALVEAAAQAPDFILDGEAIGFEIHVFDILKYGDADTRNHPWVERQGIL